MGKYIDTEKLIAEIERRKKELFEIGGDTFENKWACGLLDNIKVSVISLQQEQPKFINEIWHKVSEEANLTRPVVLSDGDKYMSPPCTFPFKDMSGFVNAMNKKYKADYTIWAYMDDLLNISSLQQEQPKFKVGDTIHKIVENTVFPMTIERISDGDYVCDGGKCFVSIKFQDDYELVEQKQPANMIKWTGSNLQEVIDFTGKSPRFGEWFNSWEEYENYVHTHNDILKLFCEDGSHVDVPVGAWIIKTPDGYNVPSVARFIHAKQEQPEVDLWKEIHKYFNPHGMELQFDRSKGNTILKPEQLFNFASHFYELGLNARKEE